MISMPSEFALEFRRAGRTLWRTYGTSILTVFKTRRGRYRWYVSEYDCLPRFSRRSYATARRAIRGLFRDLQEEKQSEPFDFSVCYRPDDPYWKTAKPKPETVIDADYIRRFVERGGNDA